MDNKEFDDIIKKKLESLSGNASDDGWDLFRQKWEDSNVSDDEVVSKDSKPQKTEQEINDEFDAKVKYGMESLRVPFNSLHWIQLKAKLIAEARFKKQLFVAKTVEILMLAFIVIGVLNIWPIQTDLYQLPINDIPMVTSIQVDKVTAERYNAKKVLSDKVAETISMKLTQSLNKINPIDKLQSLISGTIESNNPQEIKVTPSSKVNENNSENQLLRSNINKELFPFLPQSQIEDKSIDDELVDNNLIASLGSQEANLLNLPNRPLGYPDITLINNSSARKEKSFVSLAIGPDVALVNSPFDPVYNENAYNTLNTNYSVSAKLHKELGAVEVYAGLGYQNTSYKPKVVSETYSKSRSQLGETSLQNIEFKQVNIPVGVKYNIINKPSFQVYAGAGVNMNFIADANYDVEDYTLLTGGAPIPNSVIQKKNNSGVNERSKLSQKEFNNGILSGGSIRDNMYATANISLGLVKKVSERTSVFVEPKYSHFISSQGIGPNNDKVHGVSVDLGVRYQLN